MEVGLLIYHFLFPLIQDSMHGKVHALVNIMHPCMVPVYINTIRPDQFNLLLLGYCEVKIGPSDRKKKEKKSN